MGNSKELIIGKLTKPHGIKGEVRMHYYGNDPDDLLHLKKVNVTKEGTSTIRLDLEGVRLSSKRDVLILKFKQINSASDAASLRGGVVRVLRSSLKKLSEDEYYWVDLIGMLVYDEVGELLGEIKEIFQTKGNDVYLIRRGKKELLIPAIKDVVKKVDVCNKVMYVSLLEGMRDDF